MAYIDRMHIELTELRTRILALSEKIFTPEGIHNYDARTLAIEQLKAMHQYAEILLERIEIAQHNDGKTP